MILIILGVGLLLVVLRTAQIAWFSPLSAFPNAHFLAPFTPLWLLWIKAIGRENRLRGALHEELGPVIRLGPHELSINDTDSVKTVYRGGFEKTEWYKVFSNYGENVMFSTIESKPHAERKRMLSHVYSKSHIQNSPEIKAILDIMTINIKTELGHFAGEDKAIDFYKLTKSYGMDVMTAHIFGVGRGTNFIQDSRYTDPLENFEVGLSPKVVFYHGEIPRLTDWMKRLGVRVGLEEASLAWQSVEHLCFSLCEKAKEEMLWNKGSSNYIEKEKRSDGRSYPTVYEQLYNKLQESGNVHPEKLDIAVAAEILDHMLAGNELIGVTLSYLAWELSTHPEMHHRLQEEIKTCFDPEQRDPECSSLLPSGQIIDSLPVLDAVLQETMRLHPGSFGPFPRIAPAQGAQIAGVEIPAGTVISTSVYSLHTHAAVFPSPNEWRPERWMEVNEEDKREMLRWFWVFGSGGRMCIGNHLAVRMMKAFIVAVYAEFESSEVCEKMPEQVDGLMSILEGNKAFMKFRKVA